MNEINFKTGKDIEQKNLLNLYLDAGWTNYTSSPDILSKAVSNSIYVLSAWKGEKLVGLLRAVGDGLTIIYIQDILVLKSFKRQGIGRYLIEATLKKYSSVRQIALLTDADPETNSFYESTGFNKASSKGLCSFIKINS